MTSISEFQSMMRRIYFSRDSKRGAHGTYMWLREEIDELGEAIQKNDKTALEDEFADIVAWLASLANVLKVDLDKATLRKYADCCPKCHATPCKCPFLKVED